ncbi:hypothetical protein BGW39_007247 [Mortierella sp. 14UC]|nr:hypothetical protein BGW39_007247 [Mortierella sp. 14UC]
MPEGFFDVPELVAQLGLYLYPVDLLPCIQVNHAWNKVFTSFLWQTIDDSTDTWVDILRERNQQHHDNPPPTHGALDRDEWLFSIFAKYGHHIRHLRIQFIVVLRAASAGGTCTGLKSLILEVGRYGDGPQLVYMPPFPIQPPLPAHGQPAQGGGLFGGAVAAAGGMAPVAGGFGGFGGLFGQAIPAPAPPPQPVIELSEPLFPDYLTAVDIIPKHIGTYHTVESIKAVQEDEWINTQHLWHLVRTNPGLTRLDLSKRVLVGLVQVSVDHYYATFKLMKSLKVLDGQYHLARAKFWTVLECLPEGIESLAVDCEALPVPNPLPEPRPSLRVLNVRGSVTVNELLTLLEVFPNLTHLSVGEVQSNPTQPWASSYVPLPAVPRGGRSLKRIDALQVRDWDWDTILQHIPSIVEWSSETELSENDVEVLTERFPRLESYRAIHLPVNLDDYPGARSNSDPTNEFMVTQRYLREFDSIENFIKVDEMLRQPWACMGLERLTCRIVGVDRLNKEEEALVERVMVPGYSSELSEEEKGAVEKFHRCRVQHHGVYDRLASLTRLRHLNLGYENRNPWEYKGGNTYTGEDGNEYLEYSEPTFDTLEMSLESGLERLAALRDLEMIGFECINHRIGKAELDWMAKSWPKLRLMYGLDKERLFEIEYDKNRAALKKYFKRLRPDVVHDSLFEDNI